MSDKRVAEDNRYFRQKFKHHMGELISHLEPLYRLAIDRGYKDKNNILHQLINDVGRTSSVYLGYRYSQLDSLISLYDEIKERQPVTKLEQKRINAINCVRSELHNKCSNRVNWNIEVNNTADGCGVVWDNGNIKKVVVPIMYENHHKTIGSLATNKVLIWCRPFKHDTYKCWTGQFLTFTYNNGNKRYKSVNCYIMKDDVSETVYFHEDYRLCANGMRRAIARKIAARIK